MALLVLGSLLIVLGVNNMRGNISSIHWYNRRKVTAKDAPKYGKLVGAGTAVIGGSLILAAILEALSGQAAFQAVPLIGVLAGIPLILHAQFKYNKGLF